MKQEVAAAETAAAAAADDVKPSWKLYQASKPRSPLGWRGSGSGGGFPETEDANPYLFCHVFDELVDGEIKWGATDESKFLLPCCV